MVRNLIAFPLLATVVILQSAVISRITLLAGYADLMLIVLTAMTFKTETSTSWLWTLLGCTMVSFVSKMPWPVIFVGYIFAVFLAQLLRQRIWQAPLLAMFIVVFIGSLTMNLLAFLVLTLLGGSLPFGESIGQIILPSVLLNLLLTVPVYVMVRDLAGWISPGQDVE